MYTCNNFHFILDVCIEDNTDPVIRDCPSDQTAITDSESPTATVSWTEPTATDNRGDQTLTSEYSPGDVFEIGTTEVTYTSTDPAGNSATCTFNVIVTGRPRNIKIYCS